MLASAAMPPAPSIRVADYELFERLGEGGAGQVYRAQDRGGTSVAVKLLGPAADLDPEAAHARFRREVEILRVVLHDARVAANAAIYREQLEELAAEFQRGTLTKEEFERDGREIEHRIVSEYGKPVGPQPAGWRPNSAVALVVGLLLLGMLFIDGNSRWFGLIGFVPLLAFPIAPFWPGEQSGLQDRLRGACPARLRTEPARRLQRHHGAPHLR